MLYREIIAVCSQIHTKHINTLCGQNVELLNVRVVHRATTELTILRCAVVATDRIVTLRQTKPSFHVVTAAIRRYTMSQSTSDLNKKCPSTMRDTKLSRSSSVSWVPADCSGTVFHVLHAYQASASAM